MIKTFPNAVKFLEKYIPTPDKKHPGELGLKRMEYLMELLGNPQLKYPTIHVGGTSGKGSTSTFIASMLATKYKVGLTTSPHLVKINERIKLNGMDITDTDFVRLINKIKPLVEKIEKNKLGAPSYWEIVTAITFLYFDRQKVDIAIIEVGLGGKFDASNVIKPVVAVITNVGLDHTDILGDTVEKIAREKAGIIKQGIKVVSAARQQSVIKIIEEKCKKEKAKLSLLHGDFSYKVEKLTESGIIFDYFGKLKPKNLKISLLGEHQIENAALAIRAIEHLTFNNQQLTIDNIRKGLLSAYIPGRLEIIQKKPLVVLDGAHNPDKVRALVASIKKIFPGKKIIAIIAIKNDKNAREMLTQLLKISHKVIFTKFQLTADIGIINSYDPEELLKISQTIDKKKQMMIIKNAQKALEKVIKSAKSDDVILITGSLYLVGEIKREY
ncbi:bifunctional folylpolyglutamate synthase/dihydrofolate synthase [Candidatus Gottesmanbacteria bacterium]|nr:bifunctional folylpolyglutamate synthase/dihydrofolate synthase [Candidatus Gottesmanbacteria bacterium]